MMPSLPAFRSAPPHELDKLLQGVEEVCAENIVTNSSFFLQPVYCVDPLRRSRKQWITPASSNLLHTNLPR